MLRFVTILFLIGFACGAPKKSVINDPQLVKMLESIPGEDRPTFIKQQIFVGYVTKILSLRSYKIPSNVSVEIYNVFMRNRDLTKSEICFADGTCIDPDDPTIYP